MAEKDGDELSMQLCTVVGWSQQVTDLWTPLAALRSTLARYNDRSVMSNAQTPECAQGSEPVAQLSSPILPAQAGILIVYRLIAMACNFPRFIQIVTRIVR